MSIEKSEHPDKEEYPATANGEWDFVGEISTSTLNPLLFADNICLFEDGYYSMRSLSDFQYRWRLPNTGEFTGPDFHTDGLVYATVNDRVHAIQADTGEISFIFEDPDCTDIDAYSDRTLFSQDDESHLLAFDLKDGKRRWKSEGGLWINSVLASTTHVVLERSDDGEHSIEVLAEPSGERIARFDPLQPLRQGDTRYQLKDWSQSKSNYCTKMLIVDGDLMVAYADGNLVRLRLPTLDIVWVCTMKVGTVNAMYHGGKLYTMLNNDATIENALTCIDWATGQILWTLEHSFTPDGVLWPVMVGKYIVASRREHATAYDVEKREFVWRYHDETPRFGRGLWASGPWLASCGLRAEPKVHVFRMRR